MMSVSEIFERDLERTAVHEAAHLIVHRQFGGGGWITLRENPDADFHEEPLVLGRATLSRLDDNGHRMTGLAGVCAEHLLDDYQADGREIFDLLEYGDIEMSATDADMTGDYHAGHVDQVLNILRANWSEVQRYAGYEIAKFTRVAMRPEYNQPMRTK
jgi:hypothetical protein